MANYLFIELVNVVVGLPLGLDVYGVVLNTFGCGHDQLSTGEKTGWSEFAVRKEPRIRRTVREGGWVGSRWRGG